MPIETPTAEQLKARFPEFVPVDDARVGVFLQEASSLVDDTWVEADQGVAILAAAAHNMSMEGEPLRSSSGNSSKPISGPIKRRKVGDTETEFIDFNSQPSSGQFGSFRTTPYGRKYLQLLKLNCPAVGLV